MTAMVVVSAFLFTFLRTADCSNVITFNINDEGNLLINTSAADNPPKECLPYLKENNIPLFNYVDRQFMKDSINSVCADTEGMRACLRAVYPYAGMKLQIAIGAALSNIDFVCSEEGKLILKEYWKSPCSNNSSKSTQLKELIDLCLSTTDQPHEMNHGSFSCFEIRRFQKCTYDTAMEICDEPTATVLEKLLMNYLGAVPGVLDCFMEDRAESIFHIPQRM